MLFILSLQDKLWSRLWNWWERPPQSRNQHVPWPRVLSDLPQIPVRWSNGSGSHCPSRWLVWTELWRRTKVSLATERPATGEAPPATEGRSSTLRLCSNTCPPSSSHRREQRSAWGQPTRNPWAPEPLAKTSSAYALKAMIRSKGCDTL